MYIVFNSRGYRRSVNEKGGILIQTIKIVGISGAGKTTLIKSIREENPTLLHVSFGELYREFGESEADVRYKDLLRQTRGLILIDEHLEFSDYDRTDNYRAENTVAIFFLEVSPDEILRRRIEDHTRNRLPNKNVIVTEQVLAKDRALSLAKALNIPIAVMLDATIEESVYYLGKFIDKLLARMNVIDSIAYGAVARHY